jgi:transposase
MNKLYVGIDIHLKRHVVSIVPITMFQDNKTEWKRTKSITIGNNRHDFEHLNLLLKSQNALTNQVSIAIDHTGGHYSEPISYFLKSKGYQVNYLGPSSVKAAKERLLGEENKTDKIDSATLAYLLYLRDLYKVDFHISATSANFESLPSLLRSLLLQSRYYRKLMAQTTNRLRQYVHAVFPEGEERYFKQLLNILPNHPTPEDIITDPDVFNGSRLPLNTRKAIPELAKKTVGIPGETYKYIIQDLASLRVSNKENMEAIDHNIRTLVIKHPYSSILMSFPGLKEKSAAIIISTVKDINNWPTKNKFKKGLAVYGIVKETGEKQVKFRRGLSGDRMCRHGLFMVCLTAVHSKSSNDFKDYYV